MLENPEAISSVPLLEAEKKEELSETKSTGIVAGTLVKGLAFLETTLPPESAVRENAYEALIELGIRYTQRQTLKDMRTGIPEGLKLEKNEHYRPYTQVLSEGIDKYKKAHPGAEIYWSDDLELFSTRQLLETLNGNIPIEFAKSMKTLGERADVSVMQATLTYLKEGNTSRAIFLLMSSFPERHRNLIYGAQDTDGADGYDEEFKETFESTRAHIEKAVAEKGGPVSASELIYIMLEQNEGNLEKACLGTAVFLKYVARSDLRPSDSWMGENILDEYSLHTPYQKLKVLPPWVHRRDKLDDPVDGQHYRNVNYLYPNRTGLAYHSAHIAALTPFFPPEVLTMMTLGEHMHYGEDHGKAKLLSDLMLLKELYAVKKLFKSQAKQTVTTIR